jgi:hypothetical protein
MKILNGCSSLAAGALVAVLLLAAPAAAVNLLTNGGFEEPTSVQPGTYSIFNTVPGWTSTLGAGIEIQDHIAGLPFAGQQFLELDSDNNSNALQTVNTVPGGSYLLKFEYSPRPGIAANSNGIRIFFNDVLIDEITGNGQSETVWSSHAYDLTANSSISILAFQAVGISDSYGGYLDNIELEEILRAPGADIPEPSSLLLFASALFVLGVYIRRVPKLLN